MYPGGITTEYGKSTKENQKQNRPSKEYIRGQKEEIANIDKCEVPRKCS